MEKEMLRNLARSVLFRGFSREETEHIASDLRGGIQKAEKGIRLINEGESPSHVGIVLQGTLHAVKTYGNGSISIMDYLYPSMLYGLDMLLTTAGTSEVAIESVTGCKVFRFPFAGISSLEAFNGEKKLRLYENIMTYLANENVRKQRKVEIISQNSLRSRIWTYFRILYARRKTPDFIIPFSREQMADYLCVNRSALSNELSRMRREGLIDFHKNAFEIKELSCVREP
jgi:CRP-like cAMP-binding protein